MSNTATNIPLKEAVRRLGHNPRTPEITAEWAKKYELEDAGSISAGRGLMTLVTMASLERALAKKKEAPATEAAESDDDPQLHVIALETKMDRMEAEMKDMRTCMELILKGSNRMADIVESHGALLGKIAKDLGCS